MPREIERNQIISTWEGYVNWRNKPALRGRHGGMFAASLVLVAEILESLAYIANASNLVLYLSEHLHMSPSKSANSVTNFMGTAFFLALLGGFLCDALLTTYHVFVISAVIELLILSFRTGDTPKDNTKDKFGVVVPIHKEMMADNHSIEIPGKGVVTSDHESFDSESDADCVQVLENREAPLEDSAGEVGLDKSVLTSDKGKKVVREDNNEQEPQVTRDVERIEEFWVTNESLEDFSDANVHLATEDTKIKPKNRKKGTNVKVKPGDEASL
ncbi:hypothetical protein Fmac_005819 [Flemingia macrophylla]|uniref:Uncharacterized protein n=1 Tax=Flemingia macrophylla TaxID=520843 RepID=A0ABD1N900_9FABA